MAVSGISSTSFFDPGLTQAIQGKKLQFQKELQQLSQDLQAGNLSASQVDFAALQKLGGVSSPTASSSAPATATAAAPSVSPLAADLRQLGKDVEAGNLSVAQQDFTKLQADAQSETQGASAHHHRHYDGGVAGPVIDHFNPAAKTGGLTAAQQGYSALQGVLQQFAQNSGASGRPDISALLSGVSVSA